MRYRPKRDGHHKHNGRGVPGMNLQKNLNKGKYLTLAYFQGVMGSATPHGIALLAKSMKEPSAIN